MEPGYVLYPLLVKLVLLQVLVLVVDAGEFVKADFRVDISIPVRRACVLALSPGLALLRQVRVGPAVRLADLIQSLVTMEPPEFDLQLRLLARGLRGWLAFQFCVRLFLIRWIEPLLWQLVGAAALRGLMGGAYAARLGIFNWICHIFPHI